ncbi:MAG: hypothetical protein GC181_01535 [Bacteroidetes bacterium]|nr:hypothetical protein [Bacteroidota bacterium]
MRLKSVILLFALMCFRHADAQQYHFRQFGLAEGVPQSQVYDILNDSRGFLWLGTRGAGISRFDGRSFRNYQSGQGLINNFVNCLYEDSNGDIWIGTQAGVSCFNGHTFTNYPISDQGEIRVFSILQFQDKMLFGTNHGLYVKQQNKITHFNLEQRDSNIYVTSLVQHQQMIFAGTNRGLIKVSPRNLNVIKMYHISDGLPDNYIQCLAVQNDSTLFIGTYGRGLAVLKNNKVKVFPASLPADLIAYDLLIDEKGMLWIASQRKGAYRIDLQNGSVDQYTERSGLSNNHVRCIEQDFWGSIWLGTSGGGINQFTGQWFSNFTKKDGLADNYVYAISQGVNGSIWVANGMRGVTRIDSIFTNLKDSVWENKKIKCMVQTRDSTWWFGTEGNGILLMKGENFTFLNTENGLCGDYIKDLETDGNTVYVATLDGGISIVNRDEKGLNFKQFRYQTELPSNRIFSLHLMKNGDCWFGTEREGIGRIRNEVAKMIIKGDRIHFQAPRAMRSDTNNNLWIATSGGLLEYLPESDSLIRRGETELKSSNLYLLEFDANGKLYIGHEKGLDVLTLNSAGEVIDGLSFGAPEGFVGIETCQNSVLADNEGFMWFGTVNGLTRYNPSRLEVSSKPPKVWLENVDLFYEPIPEGLFHFKTIRWDSITGLPEFSYNKNHFGFTLNGIHLTHPARVMFQWMLEGYEESWTPVSSKRDATYSNLPPGNYVFRYRAVTDDGQISAEKEWPFVILAPFWQTLWFRILVSVFILALLIFSFGLYLRRLRKQREQLEFEKELIELEQKALRLQMNPHFLFNALNSIQSLVALENTKEARNYLQKFAKLMRLTLQNSRQDRIALSDEISTLDNYLVLEQLGRNPAFQYEIKVDENLETDEVMIPPMMVQPFVENAIKHGVAPLGNDGKIELRFKMEDHFIVVEIQDNGVGRKASMEKNASKAKSHDSAAIQVTTDRLEILNREHPGHSLSIEDLEENGNPSGTKVVLRLWSW